MSSRGFLLCPSLVNSSDLLLGVIKAEYALTGVLKGILNTEEELLGTEVVEETVFP